MSDLERTVLAETVYRVEFVARDVLNRERNVVEYISGSDPLADNLEEAQELAANRLSLRSLFVVKCVSIELGRWGVFT